MNGIKETAINREELHTLVPHRGKMFLLSRITGFDLEGHVLVSEYDITRDCLFYREELGGVPSWVGFEFMAQSISALSGMKNRNYGKPPQLGFVLSVSQLQLYVPVFKEKTTVRIEVEEETKVDAIYSFRGAIFNMPKTEKIVEAKLTVMETSNISSVLSMQESYPLAI
ncbi:MAG: 3-hydroxylacyl-ACP dehydratase [Spirochaetaceae bacterium]|jgi:predicted hotdog family 3-hydroxylacyl-ACP dehydratase|nr:3-hydroxylacyl-ACP dehydratase [Spirochaetaceae bacterium]